MRVLVIEDHPLNRQLMVAILARHGLDVMSSETAEGGIELALKFPTDLIFMDIGLPDMDGLAASRVLRSHPETKNIPIVVVTAHAFKEDREAAFAAGCNGFLAKPVSMSEVLDAVEHFRSKSAAAPLPSAGSV